MSVLITGGAGYIGAHAAKRLLQDGERVVVVDDLSRGHAATVQTLRELAPDRFAFVEARIHDRSAVEGALLDHDVDSVLHFAAFAEVGESVDHPLRYYENNVAGTVALLQACDAAGVQRFIFSSTCATYGEPPAEQIPIREACPQAPINPYGRSKLATEHALFDYAASCARRERPFACAALRYFNVAGADREAMVGEWHEPESHLIPIALRAALGLRDGLTIFGADYPTPDGTCVRDYIHVDDLVDAHVVAMKALAPERAGEDRRVYNLGIGRGYSVREVVDAARRVTGVDFPVREGPRRPGDPPTLFADPERIRAELGWSASITDLDEIIMTAWRWTKAAAERLRPSAAG